MTARTPEPRHVAEALADLGRARALEARAYLDAWGSLVRSGVPKHVVRHFLDRDPKDTPATTALRAWRGRSGTLLLVGNRGCGKSHEGARWLHARHKDDPVHAEFDPVKKRWLARVPRGRWLTCSSWVRQSFDAQRETLERCAKASALVVDDLGAGGSDASKDAHAKLNGLLLERFGEGAPTLVCLNGTLDEVAGWLDSRLMARLEVGGDLVDVSGPNLRDGEHDDVNHPQCPCGMPGKCGHGSLWRTNHEIIELMGCELTPRGTGEHGVGPSEHTWRVGLTLELGANSTRNNQASELLKIKRGKVRERAAELAATDKTPSLRADLEAALLRMAADQGHRGDTIDGIAGLAAAEIGEVRALMRKHDLPEEEARAMHEETLAALPLADMQRRAESARSRADTQARSSAGKPLPKTVKTGEPWAHDPPRRGWVNGEPRVTMSAKPPCWTQGQEGRAKLKRCGFGVEPRPGGYVVVYAAQVKTERLPSIETAWEHAAKLAGLGA